MNFAIHKMGSWARFGRFLKKSRSDLSVTKRCADSSAHTLMVLSSEADRIRQESACKHLITPATERRMGRFKKIFFCCMYIGNHVTETEWKDHAMG
jgi:hypothetical protein